MRICRNQQSRTGCGSTNPDTAQHCTQCGRPLNYALQLLDPGSMVNGYRVVRLIGHGGFGAVYEARNPEPDPPTIALKETFNPDSITSFAGEFAVLRHLHHDNLPHYYATFIANENGYLVMELIPGQSLQEIQAQTADRRLRESQVLGYAVQLCGVLTYLHTQSPLILHRDIKPDNIRLTPDGLIKLVDFGLLKQGTDTTASSRRGLTMAYAPIEQYGSGHGGGPTDARSDIYSLGATLYHLLTGEAPLPAAQRIAAGDDPLPAPQSLNPRITPHVNQAIMTAMALTRDKRFATADHFAQALFGRAPAAPIDDDTVRVVPSGETTMTVPVRPGSNPYATQGTPTKPVPTPIPERPSGGSAPPVNQPVASPQEVRRRPIFLRVPVLLAALLLLGGGWAYLRAESPAPEQSAGVAPTAVPVAESVSGDAPPDQSAPGTLDATATALSATQTALAAGEMTAVAREAAAAQSGTVAALRQTEEALMQTAEALSAAQTAPTGVPRRPAAGDIPFGGGSAEEPSSSTGGGSSGEVCDQATVVGSISELAINPEPFISSSPVGAAPAGSRVTVLCDTTTSDERLWVRVRYAGVEGWMSTRYLAFDGQFPTDVCSIGTVVGDISFLAINVETRRTSVQRGQVPVGGQVEVLCVPSINDDERTWVMVRYGGTEGWMSTRYLDIE